MHANLMRPTRLQPAAQHGRDAESFDDVEMRSRRLAAGHDCHRRAAGRMPSDRRIDAATVRDVAGGERNVLARDRARLQLADEGGMRDERLGDDEEAARVLVEAMDDAGPWHAGELR